LKAERAEKLPPPWPADRPLAQRRAFSAANRLPAPSCLRAHHALEGNLKALLHHQDHRQRERRPGRAALLPTLTSSHPLAAAGPAAHAAGLACPRTRARTRAGARAGRRAPRARRAPPAARSTARPGGGPAAPAPRAAAGPPPHASPRRLRRARASLAGSETAALEALRSAERATTAAGWQQQARRKRAAAGAGAAPPARGSARASTRGALPCNSTRAQAALLEAHQLLPRQAPPPGLYSTVVCSPPQQHQRRGAGAPGNSGAARPRSRTAPKRARTSASSSAAGCGPTTTRRMSPAQ